MTDRPILFSAPMVRALLDGRKTQTRRLAWGKPMPGLWESSGGALTRILRPTIWQSVKLGDRLWVRETWCHTGDGVWSVGDAQRAWQGRVTYRADDDNAHTSWFPSIHMPRRFSRLTLVVTDTKRERVQDISEEDAQAEGIYLTHVQLAGGAGRVQETKMWTVGSGPESFSARGCFEDLWQSLHTKPNAWDDNPEVVALTFTVHQRNIDAMARAVA